MRSTTVERAAGSQGDENGHTDAAPSEPVRDGASSRRVGRKNRLGWGSNTSEEERLGGWGAGGEWKDRGKRMHIAQLPLRKHLTNLERVGHSGWVETDEISVRLG